MYARVTPAGPGRPPSAAAAGSAPASRPTPAACSRTPGSGTAAARRAPILHRWLSCCPCCQPAHAVSLVTTLLLRVVRVSRRHRHVNAALCTSRHFLQPQATARVRFRGAMTQGFTLLSTARALAMPGGRPWPSRFGSRGRVAGMPNPAPAVPPPPPLAPAAAAANAGAGGDTAAGCRSFCSAGCSAPPTCRAVAMAPGMSSTCSGHTRSVQRAKRCIAARGAWTRPHASARVAAVWHSAASCVCSSCSAWNKADRQAHRDRCDYVIALRVERPGLEAHLCQQLRQMMQIHCGKGNSGFIERTRFLHATWG